MEGSALKQRVSKIIIPVVLVVAVAAALYFYNQARILKQDPQALARQEVTELVERVGKLLVLPADEIPSVATVADPEALKDQAFFAKATKGDKVLIYTTSKKAILYSVTMNRVIDVAPLNIGTQKSVTPPKSATPTDSSSSQ